MDKHKRSVGVSPFLVLLSIVFAVAFAFGYACGKDRALKHNAQDARDAAQSENLVK